MSTNHLPLLLLVVIAAEAFLLRKWIARTPGILYGLLSGASLVVALAATIFDYGFAAIAVCLSLSFVFHILELRQWLTLTKRLPA
jgi:hypothetical protein